MSQEIWLDFPYKTQVLKRRCFKSAVRVRVVAQKSAVRVRPVAQERKPRWLSLFVYWQNSPKSHTHYMTAFGIPFHNKISAKFVYFKKKQ